MFTMYSWRDEAYYRSDPWRGKWDTEGGGVLVNQSPHQLDLLQWLMGPVDEVSGYWANLNHPYVEVEDTAVAMIRFRSGGLGSIVTSLSQKPGIYTKVHVHGSNGASVGVETDRGATFIAGMTAIAEPPLNDLWTIPGEEAPAAGLPGRGPRRVPADRRHARIITRCRSRTSSRGPRGPPAAGDRRGRPQRRGDLRGDLSLSETARPVRFPLEDTE